VQLRVDGVAGAIEHIARYGSGHSEAIVTRSLEASRAFREGVDAAGIARARARVIADLAKLGVIDGHRPIAEHHVVMDPAYVHITQGSLADVAQKKRILEGRGVSSIGRYGSWTYCSIEDNVVEARALADQHAAAWAANR